MIIIEGCDKCGKSSIAAALHARIGWPVVKFNQPTTPDPCDEYLAALEANPDPFIADRFHLGEFVYGPLYRHTRPSRRKMRLIEDQLIARRALLVLMWDYEEDVVTRFKLLEEKFAKLVDAPVILGEFHEAWLRSRASKVPLRWSADEVAQRLIVDRVARLAVGRQ